MNVTRAVLPEGWIESLAPEVARFGIRTMIVEPGFFRTDLLTLADALIKIVGQDEPPVRWVAGAEAVHIVASKGRDLIAQADACRDL